jgi:hypothetical protein
MILAIVISRLISTLLQVVSMGNLVIVVATAAGTTLARAIGLACPQDMLTILGQKRNRRMGYRLIQHTGRDSDRTETKR